MRKREEIEKEVLRNCTRKTHEAKIGFILAGLLEYVADIRDLLEEQKIKVK